MFDLSHFSVYVNRQMVDRSTTTDLFFLVDHKGLKFIEQLNGLLRLLLAVGSDTPKKFLKF